MASDAVVEETITSHLAFQSALRFAVVSDPPPWHAVLTSPVVVVLHTTPPHPLQPGDRTCPKWGKTPSQTAFDMYPVWFQNWVPYPVFWVHPRFLNSNISNVCNRKVGFLAPYPKNWVHFPKLGTNWVHDITQNVTISLPFVNLLLTFDRPLHEQMPLRRTSSSPQQPP